MKPNNSYFEPAFKFYSLGTNINVHRIRNINVRRIRKEILQNKIYASNPLNFNDPFDCRTLVDYSGTPEQKKNFIETNVKKKWPELNRSQFKAKVRELSKQAFQGTFDIEKESRILENVGIASFSRSVDNILLWSHYADDHKGICLEFQASQESHNLVIARNYELSLSHLQEVNYSPNYPVTSMITSTSVERYQNLFLTKALAWEYEEEERIVVADIGVNRHLTYPPEELKAIYFGCQMTGIQKATIAKWIKKKGIKVKLYYAKKMDNKFGLEFLPYLN